MDCTFFLYLFFEEHFFNFAPLPFMVVQRYQGIMLLFSMPKFCSCKYVVRHLFQAFSSSNVNIIFSFNARFNSLAVFYHISCISARIDSRFSTSVLVLQLQAQFTTFAFHWSFDVWKSAKAVQELKK